MFASMSQALTYGLTFLLPDLYLEIGGAPKDVGQTLTVTAVVTLAIVLLLKELTSRTGHMAPLSASGAACSIALILFATADRVSFQTFLAGAFLGIGWGIFYVLGPIVLAQVLTKDRRVVYFTWLSTFVMAGIGMGPVLGYFSVQIGWGVSGAFIVAAGMALFSMLIFAFLSRSFPLLRVAAADVESGLSPRTFIAVMKSPAWRPIVMVGVGASVFAAINNFQTVYAAKVGLNYAVYFVAYTVTVIVGRFAMAHLIGSRSPYAIIASLMGFMTLSVVVFLIQSDLQLVYILASVLFGIGYGVAYPIVYAMAANDAQKGLTEATLQLFGMSYFAGIFGFPFVAGWALSVSGLIALLTIALLLSALEGSLAFQRWRQDLVQ